MSKWGAVYSIQADGFIAREFADGDKSVEQTIQISEDAAKKLQRIGSLASHMFVGVDDEAHFERRIMSFPETK